MGKYVVPDAPEIDRLVEGHMATIVGEIETVLTPRTVVLFGSFGHGEGSVQLDPPPAKFHSDYELLVVSPEVWRAPALKRRLPRLTQLTGVETELKLLHPSALRRHQWSNFAPGTAPPSILMYELHSGSRVVAGEPGALRSGAVDPAAVPLLSGVHLLFNRMAEAVKHFDAHRLDCGGALSIAQAKFASKLVLACSDALLLEIGRYHYSYRERAARFTAEVPSTHPVLRAEPDLADLVRRATRHKLQPTGSSFLPDVAGVVSTVLPACGTTLRHVVGRACSLEVESFGAFAAAYADRRASARGLKRLGLLPDLVRLGRAVRAGIPFQAAVARELRTPLNDLVYAAVPGVFFGLGARGAARWEYLLDARRALARLVRMPPAASDPNDEWCRLRDILLRVWYGCCY